MLFERSDQGLHGYRIRVVANEVVVASGKTVPYPTWIGFIEDNGKIHVWTPAAYLPRGYKAAAKEMLERARDELRSEHKVRNNPIDAVLKGPF